MLHVVPSGLQRSNISKFQKIQHENDVKSISETLRLTRLTPVITLRLLRLLVHETRWKINQLGGSACEGRLQLQSSTWLIWATFKVVSSSSGGWISRSIRDRIHILDRLILRPARVFLLCFLHPERFLSPPPRSCQHSSCLIFTPVWPAVDSTVETLNTSTS